MSGFLKILKNQNFRDYLKLGNFKNLNLSLLQANYNLPPFYFERYNSETVTALKIYTLEGCEIASLGTTDIKYTTNYIYFNPSTYYNISDGKYYFYQITTDVSTYYSELYELKDLGFKSITATALWDSDGFDLLDNEYNAILENV